MMTGPEFRTDQFWRSEYPAGPVAFEGRAPIIFRAAVLVSLCRLGSTP